MPRIPGDHSVVNCSILASNSSGRPARCAGDRRGSSRSRALVSAIDSDLPVWLIRNPHPHASAPHPPTTPSCHSRWRRWICAAAWCGSGPRSTKSCRGTIIRAPVAKLLGEAIALAALFGSSLKFDGRFILQTQGDGPVRMLVVDYVTGGRMRACARFDKDRVADAIAAGQGFGRRTARARPSGHDHRPGRRHEPLSGAGRARRRRARRGRA